MQTAELYEAVWSLLVEAVRREAERTSGRDVARRLGVSPMTISRWLSGERGERVALRDAINAALKLGVPVEELLRAVAPQKADLLLSVLGLDDETQKLLQKILEENGLEKEKLRSEIHFLSKRKS